MGSSSTQKTEIPKWVEDLGRVQAQRAVELQEMGYMPYMGPEVAAVNPYEQAMASNVGGMASAFGLQAPATMDMGGMPTVTQGGLTGYTSYPSYISSLERLKEQRPDMYAGLAGMTKYDPITGLINPDFQSNMPIFDAPVQSNMPVYSGDDDAPMFAPAPTGSTDPRSYSPRPVLRGENTGSSSGLFSGIRSARDEFKNTVLDALGVV